MKRYIKKMVKVIISKDCGNPPKNQFHPKLSIAFTQVNTDYLHGVISDDISWNIIGEKLVKGKAEFTEALVQLNKHEVACPLTWESWSS
jgi:hypothetical protein